MPRSSMLACVLVLGMPALAAAQLACQPGRFASASTGACEPCDLGRYQPAIGQEACFPCEAGRFADAPARTACDACGPGRFQGIGGQSSCDSCAAGSFRDATGQTSCVACAAGRFAHVDGATACESCAPGRFSDIPGVTACASCGPGRYASDGAATCKSCEPGRYASGGAEACASCAPGKFIGIAGATVCDSCPAGKYSGATVDGATGETQWASTCISPNAYNCYNAKDKKDPQFVTSFTAALDVVSWSTNDVKVKGPAMVCVPVDIGSGVEDPSARQCCYKVAAPGLPKPHPRVRTSGGRFTGSSLEVLKLQVICEPCGADLLP